MSAINISALRLYLSKALCLYLLKKGRYLGSNRLVTALGAKAQISHIFTSGSRLVEAWAIELG